MKFFNELWKVDFLQKLFDCACTHFNFDKIEVFIIEVAIIVLVNEVALLEAGKNALLLEIICFELIEFLSLLFSELLKVCALDMRFLAIASVDSLLSNIGLSFEILEALSDFFVLSVDDEISRKVNNLLDVLNRCVEQEAQCAWCTVHKPDMSNWRCKCDVTHAFAAGNTLSNKVTFLIDGSFAGANTLELWIVWINVLYWTENAFAEQAIAFRFLRTVVNSFWFRDFAVAPVQDIILAGY